MTAPAASATAPGLPLTIDLRDEIGALIERVAGEVGADRLSEHSFANLLLFRRAHDYRYVRGTHPHLLGRTYDGIPHLMPLTPLVPGVLQALGPALPAGGCFYPIADWQLGGAPGNEFITHANPDDADYLYPAENFVHYRGTQLNKKRNLVRQLLAHHAVRSEPYSAAGAGAAKAVLAAWMQERGLASGGADEAECLRALDDAQRLGLRGHVHFADGAPAGFILAERLAPGVFAIRFAKGRAGFVGLYPFMFQHFCTAAAETVSWLNFEQDLGRTNFRRNKQSYKPARLIRKWRLRPAGASSRAPSRRGAEDDEAA